MTTTTKTPEATVPVTIPIPARLLSDLLVTAVEGGSTYWAQFDSAGQMDAYGGYAAVGVKEREEEGPSGATLRYTVVTPADLAVGVQALAVAASTSTLPDGTVFSAAGQHLADVLSDNHDATTADVVLQLTVFGELVYG